MDRYGIEIALKDDCWWRLGDWDRPPNDPLLRKEKPFTSA